MEAACFGLSNQFATWAVSTSTSRVIKVRVITAGT
jgi:hypothetical protein